MTFFSEYNTRIRSIIIIIVVLKDVDLRRLKYIIKGKHGGFLPVDWNLNTRVLHYFLNNAESKNMCPPSSTRKHCFKYATNIWVDCTQMVFLSLPPVPIPVFLWIRVEPTHRSLPGSKVPLKLICNSICANFHGWKAFYYKNIVFSQTP